MVSILTYHSQNIRGEAYAENDHVALAADLGALGETGLRVVSLDTLLDWMDGSAKDSVVAGSVVLTFDDGCDFDVRDMAYPAHGMQRSFLGIMLDHQAAFGGTLHATSFVIASREARQVIDAGSLFGEGWIGDDWWAEADAHEFLSIENHGWDHNHADLEGENRGSFRSVDSFGQCLEQVVRAGSAIEHRTGRWPQYFAYPFGESSAYIRKVFFPDYPEIHGCRAALGTTPGPVKRNTNRWNLPRYVCGRDWASTDQLLRLVSP